MGLEIQRKKDGTLRSKWWYGRFAAKGKSSVVNLGVEVKGSIPESLKRRGDNVIASLICYFLIDFLYNRGA